MFSSQGWLRTIGATISAVGGIASVVPIPVVAAWAPLLLAIGSTIGGVGVARAVVSGTVANMKANR